MEASQLYQQPQNRTYRAAYRAAKNTPQGPKARTYNAHPAFSGKTAGDWRANIESADSMMPDDELLHLMEELGLVDLNQKRVAYGRAPMPHSGIWPQNPTGQYPLRGTLQQNKYAGLDQLLAGNSKGNLQYQGKSNYTGTNYTGINIQYKSSDGTMYQFSAAGPTQNKKQMVSQLLVGLYTAMMYDGYTAKKGSDSQQNYAKA